MTDSLTKEQQLILQQYLPYEEYERFMSMFKNKSQVLIPTDTKEKNQFILNAMKNHDYWGVINGWGEKRYYYRIPKTKYSGPCDNSYLNWFFESFHQFTGTTENELNDYLDECSYKHYKIFHNTEPGVDDREDYHGVHYHTAFTKWKSNIGCCLSDSDESDESGSECISNSSYNSN